ncbi:hypothetical protein BpHYR1_009803 [Brachionus plicatilis]|uniref:Uncharacterized protein n=1 Tax=Brachionus plicatilis TaxID=10195 RepID=A0A3M7PJA0_BRAPC|nr:hypothetical protein BpHYR1_009803 [Brachionus plicatilis]
MVDEAGIEYGLSAMEYFVFLTHLYHRKILNLAQLLAFVPPEDVVDLCLSVTHLYHRKILNLAQLLAFVPPEDVVGLFNKIKEDLDKSKENYEKIYFFKYLEENWIGFNASLKIRLMLLNIDNLKVLNLRTILSLSSVQLTNK